VDEEASDGIASSDSVAVGVAVCAVDFDEAVYARDVEEVVESVFFTAFVMVFVAVFVVAFDAIIC